MINPMNVGDSSIKEITLHGNHYAEILYALDVILDPNADGVLVCEDSFLGKENVDKALMNLECLNYNDRVYQGVVRVRDFYIGDKNEQAERGVNETEEPADIYPVEE